jgi:hypothetical protein
MSKLNTYTQQKNKKKEGNMVIKTHTNDIPSSVLQLLLGKVTADKVTIDDTRH